MEIYGFLHGDFKSNNLLYLNNKVYVIDFGDSCFGRECFNKSADICFLILSIVLNAGQTITIPKFIRELANEISLVLNETFKESCDYTDNELEKYCICFQDIVYDEDATCIDQFVPSEIYKKLNTKKLKPKLNIKF